MELKIKGKDQYAYDTGLRLVLDFGFFKRHGMQGMLRLADHKEGDFMEGLLDGATQVVEQERKNRNDPVKEISDNGDWTIEKARHTELSGIRKPPDKNDGPNKTGRAD